MGGIGFLRGNLGAACLLATLIGSELFNGLTIAEITTPMYPPTVETRELFFAIAFWIAGFLLLISGANNTIPRANGAMVISLYASFVVVTLVNAHFE